MKLIRVIALIILLLCLALLVWLAIILYKANKRESDESYLFKGWIARDKNGTLWFYAKKPHRSDDMWSPDDPAFMQINPRLLPSLRWDDRPIKAKLVNNKEYGKKGKTTIA